MIWLLEMLGKSRTMFNFANVSQSLYDLYLNHLGRGASQSVNQAKKSEIIGMNGPSHNVGATQANVDPETAQRMMLIKKSKSSLILPLLIPQKQGFDAAGEE